MNFFKKILFGINLLIIFAGCHNRAVTETAIKVKPVTCSNCVSEAVKGKFFLVKQVYPNSCWAAVLSMMYSWKAQTYTDEETLLQPYPFYTGLYNQAGTAGIQLKDELALYKTLGLTVEKQLNPTIKGWAEMIHDFGPLSVTIDAKPPFGTLHAILILGIYGSDSGLDTKIIYADPADGKMYEKDFLFFLKMYEAKYSVDWQIQIIHFAGINN